MRFLSPALLACASICGDAFHVALDARTIAVNRQSYPKSVVFFGSKSCRACNYILPKYIEFAEEPLNSAVPFYDVNIDGDMAGLDLARRCGVVTIPCAMVYEGDTGSLVPCAPKSWRQFKRSMTGEEEALQYDI